MVLWEEAALPRQGAAKVRGDEQKSSQACIVGRGCNTIQSPLSISGNVRILGIQVPKDTCLPREVSHVPFEKSRATEFWLKGGATRLDRLGEVSRRHISRWKRAPQRGEVSPR